MRSILKVIVKIAIAFIALTSLLLLFSTTNHISKLSKEAKIYIAPGKLLEVNGNFIHVFAQGQGNTTLVFMSGSGTSCPTLDFKSLWSQYTDDYRIVVVERAGYGWSEISRSPRDIDTMLEETRKALFLAGEDGPYILFPHSMSGLEAIYWAQRYPDEVKAIIGLDPAIPESYDSLKLSSSIMQNLAYIAARTGILRFIPSLVDSSAAIQSHYLSDEDKDAYRAIFHRSTLTINMLNEGKSVYDNAQMIKQTETPINTPMYFFISDGKEVGLSHWREHLTEYVNSIPYGKYEYVDSGHYAHNFEVEYIANRSKKFIESLLDFKD